MQLGCHCVCGLFLVCVACCCLPLRVACGNMWCCLICVSLVVGLLVFCVCVFMLRGVAWAFLFVLLSLGHTYEKINEGLCNK